MSQTTNPVQGYPKNPPPQYTAQQQIQQGTACYPQQMITSSAMPQVQPIILQVQKPPKPRLEKYNGKLSWRLAIMQFVFGGLSIVLSCTGIAISATSHFYSSNPLGYGYSYDDTVAYYIGTGIWIPLIFVSFSGAFSMCAAKQKTRCQVTANMVFCTLSSIFSVMMLGFALWALITDVKRMDDGFYYKGHLGPEYAPGAVRSARGSLAISVLWLVTGVGQCVVCVWAATLCCRVMCCGSTSYANGTDTVQYNTNSSIVTPQTQVIVLDRYGKPLPSGQVIQLNTSNPQSSVPDNQSSVLQADRF